MKNRFNRLTSKEWLPFQKSWFRYESEEKLFRENIRFFCKAEVVDDVVAWWGGDSHVPGEVCRQNQITFKELEQIENESVQFAVIDLRKEIEAVTELNGYNAIQDKTVQLAFKVYENLEYKRFMCIMIPNRQINGSYYPFAWDLAKALSGAFSLKDEKIACRPIHPDENSVTDHFIPKGEVFYCLYFKKDDHSTGIFKEHNLNFFDNITYSKQSRKFSNLIPAWFILKPQPRKKNEILHPAKYPEDLVHLFVQEFSGEGENVFDPMSGTGSTQLGALKLNRNAYGTELSDFFADIALERCQEFMKQSFSGPFSNKKIPDLNILQKDARQINTDDFPAIDYLLTSPPYWDMLNMKGAENQAKRIKMGLQTNYSDSDKDLGNIADYEEFVINLTEIYFNVFKLLRPGAFVTIVVKNIKKKGRNYPFAWDLALALQKELILLPETFWCQDDISIAPYGYGNTWVSNTFHQYCLNFQKPL